MRNVIFIAPFPLSATLTFCKALSRVPGVRLLGLFQEPPREDVGFAHVERIPDALDPAWIRRGVEALSARFGPIHRLLGVLENAQEQIAQVREELGIDGMRVATAQVFRDKARMKDALRAAGLPCARHMLAHSDADVHAFIAQVGLPVVVKPPAGAGCRATYRVTDAASLKQCLAESRPSPQRPALVEEFLQGEEHSFETLTLGGQVRFYSITRYLPTPLEVMENPWIQWCVLAPRDIADARYDAVRKLGQDVVAALGLQTGITHMEWFRRPDGSLAVGEIAARPPGARIMNLMGQVYDRDLFLDWARLMVDDRVDGYFERRYAAATVFLRQPGGNRVLDVQGLDQAQKAMGHLVVDKHLPQPGAPRADGYEGEGWVMLRHPDTEVVMEGVRRLFQTVKVRYA